MVTTTADPTGGVSIAGTAPLRFVHGSGQVASDVVFEWDFDNDGDFNLGTENFTGYVVAADSSTGRDWPSQVNGKAGPGRLNITVRNDDDRFSYFNAASPLNTAPLSLATGRKIRVRTSTSTPVDPTPLARDRFNGTGALGSDELGHTWTDQTGFPFTRDGTGRAASPDTLAGVTPAVSTVDVGTADCYLQGTVDTHIFGFLVYRWTDINNYGFAYWDGLFGTLTHRTVDAGVETVHETYALGWGHHPATIGILVSGSNITGYIAGVPVFTGATARSSAATKVGIGAWYKNTFFHDFGAWTGLQATTEGVLWTGDVTSVVPSVDRSHNKIATITAEGRLAACTEQFQPPAYQYGTPTGFQVGEILAGVEQLQPPGVINAGDVTTSSTGFDVDNALELARQLEEVEIGFLYEMPEGPVAYESRSARASRTPVAWWSDDPDAEFQFEEIEPFDWRREVINRAFAGLGPRSPNWDNLAADVDTDSNSTAAGAQNDVSVTMPSTVNQGDLLLVLIASTVQTDGRQWKVPHGWKQLNNEGDALRIRAYAKVAWGTEASRDIVFYDDIPTYAGGLWVAVIYRVRAGQWFGTLDGVAMAAPVVADVSAGDTASLASDPPALPVPWGKDPSFFITARAGLGSLVGGNGGTATGPPGYDSIMNADQDGATNAFDVSFHLATKIGCVETEDPGTFGAVDFSGYIVICATTIAVRGWNGDPPLTSGRQRLQVDNVASQARHNAVRTYPTIPELFASSAAAQAYADRITALYGDDRPIFSITFTATKNAAYRTQAVRRRVGDMIHLTANGTAGMGVDGNFFIESVSHRWSDGGLLWLCTWELSPA